MRFDGRSGLRHAFSIFLAKEYPIALWVIILVAFSLRLFHASSHYFTPDETPNILLAESIRLSFSDPHLVYTSAGHPLLIAYMAYFSGLVFGKGIIGYRMAMVLMGSLTCLVVYRVGKEIDSKVTGLFAASLIAVDQFHVTLSGSLHTHDVPLIFFGTLALQCCTHIKPQGHLLPYLGMGLWMSLAYLGKETALMLFPAIWGFMLLAKERRAVFKDPRWYLSHLIFLIVVAPDVIWNIAHLSNGGYILESAGKTFGGSLQIQAKALSLFLGEVFIRFNPDVFGGNNDYWGWPLRTMYWLAGLLYLYCTVWAWRFRQRPIVLLLHLVFLVTFLFVTVMPGGESRFDPFWWAAMAMSPSILFTGLYFNEWTRRTTNSLWIILPLLIWFLVKTMHTIQGVPYYAGVNS